MADKKNTRRLRLPVRAGLKTDGFAEDVPLIDVNDYVLLPDGSGIAPREGYEIRRTDSVGVGATRKTIYFIPNPPDLSGGDLLVIQNNKYGDRRVETVELVQSAQFEAVAAYGPSAFEIRNEQYPSDCFSYFLWEYHPALVGDFTMTVVRNTSEGRAWVRIQTEDGTATSASGAYDPIDQTFTFEDGENTKTITITVDSGAATDSQYFYLRMTQFSVGAGKIRNDDTVDGAIYFRTAP